MKKICVKILGNEKTQFIAIPVFSILLSLIVGMVIIAGLGKYPLTAYMNLLQGSGLMPKPNYSAYQGMLTDFTSFLNMLTDDVRSALCRCGTEGGAVQYRCFRTDAGGGICSDSHSGIL